jgi:hypothetical protein
LRGTLSWGREISAELAGRNPKPPGKRAPKRISSPESDRLRDAIDRGFARGEATPRFIQSQGFDKHRGRRAKLLFEATEKLSQGQRGAPGYIYN